MLYYSTRRNLKRFGIIAVLLLIFLGIFLSHNYLKKNNTDEIGKGFFYEKSGDIDKAEYYYKEAIQVNSEDYRPHGLLGRLKLYEGDLESAEEELSIAKDLNPNEHKVRTGLATIKLFNNDIEGAKDEILKAQVLEPFDSNTLAITGLVFYAMGDLGQAKDYFNQSLSINPNDIISLNGIIYFYIKDNETAKAKKLLKRAYSLDEKDPFTNSVYAMYHIQNADYDEAIEYARKAQELLIIEANRNLYMSFELLAHIKAGNDAEAEDIENQLLEYNKEGSCFHYITLANRYYRLGDKVKTQEMLKEAFDSAQKEETNYQCRGWIEYFSDSFL